MLGHNYVGTEHQLLALLSGVGGVAAEILEAADITHDRARAKVVELSSRSSRRTPDREANSGYLDALRAHVPRRFRTLRRREIVRAISLGGASSYTLGDLVVTGTVLGHGDREVVARARPAACSATIVARRSDARRAASNGWPAATKDTIVWPIGLADPPSLVAYRVPSG